MSLSSQTDVTPNKKQRRGIVVPLTKSKSNLWEVMKDSNLHLTTIRTVSSSCRCASDYTNHLFSRTSSLCILHLIYNIRGLPTPTILDGGLAWP